MYKCNFRYIYIWEGWMQLHFIKNIIEVGYYFIKKIKDVIWKQIKEKVIVV